MYLCTYLLDVLDVLGPAHEELVVARHLLPQQVLRLVPQRLSYVCVGWYGGPEGSVDQFM